MIIPQINENQFSAMVCWAYNIGLGNAAKSSAVAVANTGDLLDVPTHMVLWDEVDGVPDPGLVRRRAAEIALYNTPITVAA